jgi:ABC-type nickel/cobalt efflux system permease component RcnA
MPVHWLPVVLLGRVRKWSAFLVVLGALVSALGHVLVSGGMGVSTALIGLKLSSEDTHRMESVLAWLLMGFGWSYVLYAWFRRGRSCDHSHENHEIETRATRKSHTGAYVLLFTLGLSPCFGSIPLFLASGVFGVQGVVFLAVSFALGVILSMSLTCLLVYQGVVMKRGPWLDRYGETLTGLGVFLMGLLMILMPHEH